MPSELEKAIARGAKVEEVPNLVEVTGLADVIEKLEIFAATQLAAHIGQTELLMSSIDRLVDVISEKEIINEATDLTELVEAVSNLKQEIIVQPTPHDWEVGFERDQRGLVKSPYKLTATPRMLDS